ncbi:hypothetical protein FTX61_15920 [Nitriliruptoraceae bacterium ZYF776]|nr:hypothetical protein [Profundirhabdus halotolerans]
MTVARGRWLAWVAAAVLVLTAFGARLAIAQATGEAPPAGDDGLLVRLDALEVELPEHPGVREVAVDDEGAVLEVVGDAPATRATLDTLEADLRRLFVDADDAGTPVGDAVAEVARGWLDVRAGVGHLAAADGHDLAFPLDAEDDDDVATDADARRGDVEVGIRSVLLGHGRQLTGYTALRDLGLAEPAVQGRLDGRALASEDFARDVVPLLRALVSERTSQVLVPTDRFTSPAPGQEARARSLTVTCVDRDAYTTLVDPTEGSELTALAEAIGTVFGTASERADCPDLPVNLEVRPTP